MFQMAFYNEFVNAVIVFAEAENFRETRKPDLGLVGLAYFDEGTWLHPTPRPTLTVSRLLN